MLDITKSRTNDRHFITTITLRSRTSVSVLVGYSSCNGENRAVWTLPSQTHLVVWTLYAPVELRGVITQATRLEKKLCRVYKA